MVAQFVLDKPREIKYGEIRQLAGLMKRSTEAIKSMIEDAKETLASHAPDYVQIHKDATQQALADKDYSTAARAAEWALENITHQGVSVIEAKDTRPQAPKVMVGINIGGLTMPQQIEAESIEADAE